jgi:enoyl-[acyl-carrier protein] reductase II
MVGARKRGKERAVLRTPVCDLLGMEVPIVQAAIWPAMSPELVATVSEAGGLGSIGAVFESADSVRRQIVRVRELTPRPFAVNHVVPLLDEAAFRATLEAQPAVVSFALGHPGELVGRAHEAGAKVVHQVASLASRRLLWRCVSGGPSLPSDRWRAPSPGMLLNSALFEAVGVL